MRSNKLTIGIDIRPYLKEKAGIGQYTIQLTKALIRNDKENNYVLFSDRDFHLDEKLIYKKKIISLPLQKLSSIFFHIYTIFRAYKHCDIYITPSAMYVPAFTKNFAFLIIHDLSEIKFPQLHSFKTKILRRLTLKKALKNAKQIITVSKNTKKDLIEIYPFLNKNKTHSILSGANSNLIKELDRYNDGYWRELRTKFNIKSDRYILFVGTIEPRKNIARLIEAYANLSIQEDLVIAGRPGWGSEELDRIINSLPEEVKTRIKVTGMITEKEKAYLYKNALFLIYPSLYEGFGMPLTEAMLFNIPIITSNISSMPEVSGDAAILIDPYNKNEIETAIMTLINSKNVRQELIKKGKRQLEKLNWNNTAKSIIKLYRY